jgi:hypothetical protein
LGSGFECVEDRCVPSTTLLDHALFSLGGGAATVTETVTYDDPSRPGLDLWTFHLTNVSYTTGGGISAFGVPVEDVSAATVANIGGSAGWSGAPGGVAGDPNLGDPNVIAWSGPALGTGQSADFSFTTISVGLALTNGIAQGAAPATDVAGLLTVPTAAPAPPQPTPYPALLVTTVSDNATPTEGESSLREAIDYVNKVAVPNQRQIRFSSGIAGKEIKLGDTRAAGGLDLQKDVWINGTNRDITITRGALFVAGPLLTVDPRTTVALDGLTFAGNADSAVYSQGDLTVRNCDFHDNTAAYGAGIAAIEGTLQVLNSWIHNNHASNNGEGYGGGVFINDWVTSAVITNTQIYGNTSDYIGGGVYIVGGDPDTDIDTEATLSGDQIYQNFAASRGGGVGVGNVGEPWLWVTGNTLIENNSPPTRTRRAAVYTWAPARSFSTVPRSRVTGPTPGAVFTW